MDSFFSRYKNGLVLGLVLLAQVIGLAIQVRRPNPIAPTGESVRLLRYWMLSVIGPPERAAHAGGLGARGIWSNYIDLRHTRQRNRELQAEVDRLRLEQAGLAEDARQGHRLQQLLSFKEKYIYQTVPAQVIGTSGTDMSRILIVDKGSKDGLRIDMPVITPDGIVGKVKDVFPHAAQILEISDQSSGAGVMLETTRIRGVLRGNAYGQPQIINILPDDRIQPGERVLTSGGDQIYPRGLTVGYVDKVVNDPERNPYIDVVIRPAATLSRLEEVLIITTTGDTMAPGEASDVAKSEAEAANRHSAADELSDKLPGLKDPNDPNAGAAQEAAEAATGAGDVARPVKPPTPLHSDRFTPGTTPEANLLTPAQPMPHPPHVVAPQVVQIAPVHPPNQTEPVLPSESGKSAVGPAGGEAGVVKVRPTTTAPRVPAGIPAGRPATKSGSAPGIPAASISANAVGAPATSASATGAPARSLAPGAARPTAAGAPGAARPTVAGAPGAIHSAAPKPAATNSVQGSTNQIGAAKTGVSQTNAAKSGVTRTGAAKTGVTQTGAAKTGVTPTGGIKTGVSKTGPIQSNSNASSVPKAGVTRPLSGTHIVVIDGPDPRARKTAAAPVAGSPKPAASGAKSPQSSPPTAKPPKPEKQPNPATPPGGF